MSTEERHQYGQESDTPDAVHDVVDHAATPETVEEAGRLVPRTVADETETDDPSTGTNGKTLADLDDAAKSENDAEETFEDEPINEAAPEPTPEQLAAAARMSCIFTDRDALYALANGSITRDDARKYLALDEKPD